MAASALESVDLAPPGHHRWSVLWLHGLGADGHDFEPIVGQLGLPRDHGLRFVFPHAPRRPVTINGGLSMRAWYDIAGADLAAHEDEPGIRHASAHLESLIARERDRGIATDRIVLAGFSQGGAVALHTGLRHPERLGGLLVLSAYLPLAATLAAELAAANAATPIFQGHGDADEIVPPALACASFERVASLRRPPAWHTYAGMGHAVCAREIDDIAHWLRETVGAD